MVFTAFQARKLNPEEVNPMAGAITKAMQGLKEGIGTAYLPKKLETDLLHKQIINKYLPQMQEAEIFGKQFGPLASIATTPMFLQNPQFQKMLGQLIAQNPGMAGLQQGGQGGHGAANEPPTYAGQVQKDIARGKQLAHELTKNGKLLGYASSAGGGLGYYLGDVGRKLIGLLPGSKTQEALNPHLAEVQHEFDTFLAGMKQRAIQTGAMTPAEADRQFIGHEDENPEQTLARLQKTVPSLFEQGGEAETGGQASEEGTIGAKEEENHNDNELLTKASKLSDEIKEKTGQDIDPQFIVNYHKRFPGPINIKQLLKTAAVTR